LLEWERIVPELHALGLLTNVDRAALALYSASYGRWIDAERHLATSGLTVISPNGHEQKSPWLTIADKAMDQLRRFIAEFGLSPASRTRVSAVPPSDDDDFFENA
jgi:P27 family predicted phage terminase small subunit